MLKICLFILFGITYCFAQEQIGAYSNKGFKLTWGWETASKTSMVFNMSAPTTGWIAIGFNPDKTMPGSDVYFGVVSAAGVGFIQDRHTPNDWTRPEVDDQQDAKLLASSEQDGVTFISFSRPLLTGDKDDYQIKSEPYEIHYAFGETDEFDIHIVRGHAKYDITTGKASAGAKQTYVDLGQYTNPQKTMQIKWGYVDSEASRKELEVWFEMKANTIGWIGVGFNYPGRGSMIGADMVVASMDSTGKGWVLDRHCTDWTKPEADEQQDVVKISSSEKDGVSTYKFQRKAITKDTKDWQFGTGKTELLWAYGLEDLLELHAERGHVTIDFLAGKVLQNKNGGTEQSAISKYTSPKGDFELIWGLYFDDDDDKDKMWFQMRGYTPGWVAIGFNTATHGDMINADIITGSAVPADIADNGWVVDRHSTDFSTPELDRQQDCELLSAIEHEGQTQIKFVRKLDTKDSKDHPIGDYPVELLWAYGIDDKMDMHSHRGHATINFMKGISYSKPDSWEGSRVGIYKSGDDDDVFELSWGFRDNFENIVIKVKAKTTGWVAIGFSKDRWMPETDMIIMTVPDDEDESGKGYATDRFVSNRHTPAIDPIQNVKVLAASQKDGFTEVTIMRPVDTKDKYDMVIENHNDDDDEDHLLWAIGETDKFDIHINYGSAEIDWFDGENDDDDGYPLRWIHGMFMLLAWGLCAIFGTILARFMKKVLGVVWFVGHIFLQVVVLLFTIVGFIIIVIEVSVHGGGHFNDFHSILGLLILIGTLVQPLIGLLSHFLWKPARDHAPVFPDFIHWFLGYILLACGLINISTGLDKYDVSISVWILFLIWMIIIAIWYAIHEVLKLIPFFASLAATEVKHDEDGKIVEDEDDSNILVKKLILIIIDIIIFGAGLLMIVAMITIMSVVDEDNLIQNSSNIAFTTLTSDPTYS